jgi:pyruvate/2-oxoglutarate dehydrogenase complex dihydrolipoamide dehydrogenase (E3) component
LEDYGIPLITSYTITKIHGKERVKGVTISKVDRNFDRVIGSEKFIECDTLLLSVGLIPENELTREAGAAISKMGGPSIDNNLETTIDGIFACGNVLQVHDLVDLVTAEAKRAGLNAVEYIKKRFGKKAEKKDHIPCTPGENVNYVKPDLINRADLAKDNIFTFRVKRPDRRLIIQLKDDKNKIVFKKKRRYVIPSEMIEIKINLSEQQIDPECISLELEVIPRPEVLIEDD